MSAFSGTPDYLYSVGADTRQLEKAMADTSKKTEGAFGKVGNAIEKKTEGLRKFQGALGSTVGIATGLLGVFGAVSGAAIGLYAAYEKVAGAAERVAEANRQSNIATQKAIDLAYKRISAEEDFLTLRKRENVAAIDSQIASLREEQAKLVENSLGRSVSLGFTQLLKGGAEAANRYIQRQTFGMVDGPFQNIDSIPDDPSMLRFDAIEGEVARLEEARGKITRGTETLVAEEVTAELAKQSQEFQRQLDLQAMRANGDEAAAARAERYTKHQAEIYALEERYLELIGAGLTEEAALVENLIRLKNKQFTEGERLIKQTQDQAAEERRLKDQATADSLDRMLQEQIYRKQGRDDLADEVKLMGEKAGWIEKIGALEGVSADRRQELLDQVDRLFAIRGGEGEEGSLDGSRGPRFGASVSGNVGSLVGGQILGGGVDAGRMLDQKRNTTLTSMDQSLKELVRNSNAQGGRGAVFV